MNSHLFTLSYFSEDWFKSFKKRYIEGGSSSGVGGDVDDKPDEGEIGDDKEEANPETKASAVTRKRSVGVAGQVDGTNAAAERGHGKEGIGGSAESDSGLGVNNSSARKEDS